MANQTTISTVQVLRMGHILEIFHSTHIMILIVNVTSMILITFVNEQYIHGSLRCLVIVISPG